MNSKDYISSGLLEAYVLGSLDEPASEQVAGAMCRFPEVAAEVAALESLLIRGAEQDAIAPPPDLQDRIWAAIEASGASDSAEYAELPPPVAEKPGAIVIPFPGSPNRNATWARAAMLAVLAGSLTANVVFWSRRSANERKTAALTQQIADMTREQRALAANLDRRIIEEAQMAAQPGTQTIAMQGMQLGHPMAANMYWNEAKAEAYISIQKLPMPPNGMQYQLWVIAGGEAVSIGMLENEVVANIGLQKVPMPVADGEAFAVSLEKAGGSSSPTANKIYLIGKMPG